jgi:hypothetical protein
MGAGRQRTRPCVLLPTGARRPLPCVSYCPNPAGEEVSHFLLPVTCPDCAGPVSLLNTRASGPVSLAIVVCAACQWEYEVSMTISRHTRSDSWTEHQHELRRASKKREKAKNRQLTLAP